MKHMLNQMPFFLFASTMIFSRRMEQMWGVCIYLMRKVFKVIASSHVFGDAEFRYGWSKDWSWVGGWQLCIVYPTRPTQFWGYVKKWPVTNPADLKIIFLTSPADI